MPIVEFKANSSINSSTRILLFLAIKGYKPYSRLEPTITILAIDIALVQSNKVRANKLVECLDKLRTKLYASIT